VDLAGFSDLVSRSLAAMEIRADRGDVPGIGVADVMSARGRGFKALIIIGFNEGVWPRLRSEDPLLPDALKRRLTDRYGVKLQTAEGNAFEERLLFRLALDAAGDRLYIGWQRSDDEGRPINRSAYLDKSWRTGLLDGLIPGSLPPICFPRRLSDRFGKSGRADPRLTPGEWSAYLSLTTKASETVARIRELDPNSLARTFAAGKEIGAIKGELSAFDGITGPVDDYRNRLLEKGLTPTAVEGYVQCPYRYFASRMLGLYVVKPPEEIFQPPALSLGELVHFMLARLMREVADGRMEPGSPLPENRLEEIIEDALDHFEKDRLVGFPIVWREIRAMIAGLVSEYFTTEMTRLSETGSKPVDLESSIAATLPTAGDLPVSLRGLKIKGRLDRIDLVRDGKTEILTAVDYKYRTKSAPDTVDKNLIKGILRAQRIQPLFYPLLVRYGRAGNEDKPVCFQFHYLAPGWKDRDARIAEISPDDFSLSWWREIGHTIKLVLDGIGEGNFFILPNDICRYCDFRGLCRRDHRPTRYRNKADHRPRNLAMLASRDERKLDND
jgi:ATP-dependent helicase/nuclease subunit B